MERKYLTIKEAAEMLGVTPLTLRNWDKQGKLVAYRHPINNYRVYRLDQMEMMFRSIESPRTPQPKPDTRKLRIKSDDEN